nr:MAG TPA: tail protein [Caudoviricetes sp.]
MEYIRITILNAYDAVCARMDNEAPDALHYYDDELHSYLEGTANTFSFKALAGHEDAQYLVVGNKLAFQKDGRDYYLNIVQATQDEETVEVMAYSLSFELLNEENTAYKSSRAMSFEEYLKIFDWEKTLTLGINEVADKKISHEWTGSDTILARIFSLANVFSAEAEFAPVLNKDFSLQKIVLNVYKQHTDEIQGIGQNRTDERLRYGVNIEGITKTSDITELFTAIRPFGRDNLTVTNLAKTEYDSDGKVEYMTLAGNRNIMAPQARDRFPSNLMDSANDRYIAKIWNYDTDNVNTLYGQALAELKKGCIPKMTYEVEGYVDAHVGDTFTIIDEEFNPPLYLQARVKEQVESLTDSTQNKTTFSNYEELQSQIDPELLQQVNNLIAANRTYTCSVISSDGVVFKNGEGSTALTAVVKNGGLNIADQFNIQWYRNNEEFDIGMTIVVKAADISEKEAYRFEATDSGGIFRGQYEVTVSNVNDGEKGEQGEKGPQGEPGADGEKGDPTGIIESSTVPENKYEGMLWKNTGAIQNMVKGATYRWNGTAWELFKLQAENIEAKNLQALSAEIGTIKGTFSSDISTPSGTHKATGTITIDEGLISGEYTYSDGSSSDLAGSYSQGPDGIKGEAQKAGNGEYSYEYGLRGIKVQNGPWEASLDPGQIKQLEMITIPDEVQGFEMDICHAIGKLMYPVGSIYMSANNTDPGELFGGTWERWGKGRVPVGLNESDTDFATSEKTGGAKTHTLTTAQIPSHNHSIGHTHTTPNSTTTSNGKHGHTTAATTLINPIKVSGTTIGWATLNQAGTNRGGMTSTVRENINISIPSLSVNGAGSHTHTVNGVTTNSQSTSTSGNAGSGNAHNNLQPYITCYMWKRTA